MTSLKYSTVKKMGQGRFILWLLRRLFNHSIFIALLLFCGFVVVVLLQSRRDLLPWQPFTSGGLGHIVEENHPWAYFHKLFIRDVLVRRLKNTNTFKEHITNKMKTKMFSYHRLPKICARKFGRMGNQMFQVATLLSVAQAKGMKTFIEKDSDLIGLFELPEVMIMPSGRCEKFPVRHETNDSAFDTSWTNFSSKSDIAIAGYFQSWRYFHTFSDVIRRQFTLRKSVREAAFEAFTQASIAQRKELDFVGRATFVALHIRRGDMLNPDRVRYGNNVAPTSYIINAMNYFRRRYRDVLFIAASDDMNWVKSNVPAFDTVFLTGNNGFVDFAVLSLCEHTIFTVGTYGWWAAWLINGTTIYYKHQFSNSTHRGMNLEDYMYSHWIPME